MKIVFFGSDDFAAAHLQALIDSQHEFVACVTQPDRPKGRGMKVMRSSIKEYARKHHIPVVQPDSLKGNAIVKDLKNFQSDIFVVIAYGQFLPEATLNIPPLGAVNVHASLLPKYRGAAPINWAIINGEQETGISIIKMNTKMDAGDILARTKIQIENDDTAVTLRAKMMQAGPSLLLRTIDALSGGLRPAPMVQDDHLATLAPKLTKEFGAIQWTRKAGEIYNCVRGLLPWPSAYTFYKGKILKILEAQIVEEDGLAQGEPGIVAQIIKDGIIVATGHHGLLIKKVHLQDSKLMGVSAFLRGHQLKVGDRFE